MRQRGFLWLTLFGVAGLLALLLVRPLLTFGARTQRDVLHTDIGAGTVFQEVSTSEEFDVAPTLRLLPNPDSPQDSIAAVKLLISAKTGETHKNIQATVWLPEGVRSLTPLNVIGTNLESFRWDLTPENPHLGVLSRIQFADFEQRERIIAAFQGPTLIKIHWDGGERYLQFPGSHWMTEVVPALPEQSKP